MVTAVLPRLTSSGFELDTSPDCFGELRSSADRVDDTEALVERLSEDGYLYLPGYLDRDMVLAARRSTLDKLAAADLLHPDYPVIDGVLRPGARMASSHDLSLDNPLLMRLLYTGRMMDLYARLLGGEVRHFDFTWMRAIPPGKGTKPHEDIVFMGRGTQNVYTAWTPLGDISLELGGLIVLEGSHSVERIKQTYGQKDVDSYCINHPDATERATGTKWWNGVLSNNPVLLRKRLGLRWLTAEFRAGDLLTFGMFTAHASLDNHADRLRLSADSRYQLAADPIDERWFGERPVAHGPGGKRARIC
jgi:hypothetical protein